MALSEPLQVDTDQRQDWYGDDVHIIVSVNLCLRTSLLTNTVSIGESHLTVLGDSAPGLAIQVHCV